MTHRVTLLDVARAAGVSRATASRVLAGTPRNVDAGLAERVRQAADDLGYRTNTVARALRTGSTGTVGLLVPTIRNPYFVSLVEAFTQAAADRGLAVLLADSQEDTGVEAARIELLLGARVDGIAVVPASFSASGAALARAAARAPVVQVDRWARDAECPAVAMDNAAAVGLLVNHLRATGRRSLTFVGAGQASSAGTERIAAFRALAGPADDVLALTHFTTDTGRLAAERLLAANRLPDAVLCSADVLAVGLTTALRHAGTAIPDRVAVTGFDDTDLLEFVTPAMTTIHHPLPAIVGRALDLLTTAADAGTATPWETERHAPSLVIRESTAPRGDRATPPRRTPEPRG